MQTQKWKKISIFCFGCDCSARATMERGVYRQTWVWNCARSLYHHSDKLLSPVLYLISDVIFFFFFYIRLISGEHLLVLLIYMRSDTNPKYTPLNFDFHHKIIRRVDTKHFTRSYSPLECYICVVLVILYYNYLKIIYVIMLHPCLYSYPYWCMYFLDQKKKKT